MAVQGLIPVEVLETRILEIRGTKVILDSDLAALYGVETRRLNEQMKRNRDRFPSGFVFQLSPKEAASLRLQAAVPDASHEARHGLPFAFTEQGVLMAASVLNSRQAIQMNVFTVKAFVRLRSIFASHVELARRLDELDTDVGGHSQALRSILAAFRHLMAPSIFGLRGIRSSVPHGAPRTDTL